VKLGELVHVKAGKNGEEVTGIIVKITGSEVSPIYEVLTCEGQLVSVPRQIALLLMKEV